MTYITNLDANELNLRDEKVSTNLLVGFRIIGTIEVDCYAKIYLYT